MYAETSASEELELSLGSIFAFSRPCPGEGRINEDSMLLTVVHPSGSVIAVADGVGGGRSGTLASKIAVETLNESLQNIPERENAELRSAILDGIEAANSRIQELKIGAATTLTAVEINPRAMRVYQVGDSFGGAVGQGGAVRFLSVSQSPVGYGVEYGFLDEAQATMHEDRHIVSNVVGDPSMHIAVGPWVPLRARDTLIVGSDGVSDNLTTEEIFETIRVGPLTTAGEALAEKAWQRMTVPEEAAPSKPDDLSFLLFRYSESSFA